MASTRQFALEYVQNGRGLLEAHLQNPSLVVNELRKHNIISERQVRKVMNYKKRSSKTRVLLDMVIRKGEAASDDLLRILYDTRNRTLPRANPTQKPSCPDLHYWISCFSFTEDPDPQSDPAPELGPCERYKKQLRTKANELVQAGRDQSLHFLKDKAKCKTFTYIPVVLDTDTTEMSKIKSKAYKKSRTKKLKTYIPKDKGNLTPNQLLKNNEKNILLVGKPGIGKTTVVQQVLSVWAENEDNVESYMFYFDESSMRSMSHSSQPSSLRSLLFDRYLKPEEGTDDEVLCDINKNSENVIVVFDGIMDAISNSVVMSILNRDLLCDAKILTTCRPEAEDCEVLTDWPSYRVEVKGFNDETIHAYFEWMLGTGEDYAASVFNNLAVFSLCHVPMYAFIVAACISFCPSDADNHLCTITEMYIKILRHCLKHQDNQNVENLDTYIHCNKGNIKFLAAKSFHAMLAKTVNLTGLDRKDNSVQRAFLTTATEDASTSPVYTFLHNTMHEFWAALFLLMTPDNITTVLQQCQTEDGKYLKYMVSFFCGLLSRNVADLIKGLVPEDEIRAISDSCLETVIDTFLSPAIQQTGHDESGLEVGSENILFVCQCLYELQSPEACLLFLSKVANELDLCGEQLDPQQCCAVSYVINQSAGRNIKLDMRDCTLSDRGVKLILGSLENLLCLRLDPITQCQMWAVALQSGTQSDLEGLLRLCDDEIHLPVREQADLELFPRVREVLKQRRSQGVKLCLHLAIDWQLGAVSLGKGIFASLPSIEAIRFVEPADQRQIYAAWKMKVKSFQQDLLLCAAVYQIETGLQCVEDLQTVLSLTDFLDSLEDQNKFMLSLYQHVRHYESSKGVSVLKTLQPVFTSTPAVWYVNLADETTSNLLEVMKLQNVKKPVELWWSGNEGELKTLLQCLPFISQLRFNDCIHIQHNDMKATIDGLLKLFHYAIQHRPETGEETLSLLSSVCSYPTFPFASSETAQQSDFLLHLYSSVKVVESKFKDQIFSAFVPVFRAAPAVWVFDLSTDNASVLLEVMKLHTEKKHVHLNWLNGDLSKIQSFVQCLPYISQVRISPLYNEWSVEKEPRLTSEYVEALLSALLSGQSEDSPVRCLLMLDLYKQVKDYEMQTGRSLIGPSLLHVYQAPAVWSIDVSEGKASLLLEVLKLQPEKKPVKLRGWSDEIREVRTLLQCLLYISQLSCDGQLVLALCEALTGNSEEGAQLSLSLLQALDYTITLSGWLPTLSCKAVGALLGQSTSGDKLNVTFTPQSVSLHGAALLFRQVKVLHKLRINEMATVKLTPAVRYDPLVVEELTLVLSSPNPTEGMQCRVLSNLASLLKRWTIRVLDLSCCALEGHHLTGLLCHQGPLTIRLSPASLQQLAVVVYEAQDEQLTDCFLEKVDRDLSDCTLGWSVLYYLLKSTTQPVTVNLRRSRIKQRHIPHLLPILNNIHFQRISAEFQRTALKTIYEQRAGHLVTTLLKSSDQWITLSNLVLDHADCDALRFALHYSDGIKLDLLGTIIPKEELGSILTLLHRVSELRVERKLLLQLLHACAGLRILKVAVSALMTVLHHKLDFSCSSVMSDREEGLVLSLSYSDCRVLSLTIQEADGNTELNLHDCQVEDAGLEELLSVLHKVHLSLEKSTLLQLLQLLPVGGGDRSVGLATLLSRALGKEVDLSQTRLDLKACSSLALILGHSEGLSELDLSHCQLTDSHIDSLLPHLHKIQVLNLSSNEITDDGAVKLNLYMIGNSFTETVGLFNNKITEFDCFLPDKRYKLRAHVEPGAFFEPQGQTMTHLGCTSKVFAKTKPTIEKFDPEKTVRDSNIAYRFQCVSCGMFQCRATGLVFGMRGPATVEYYVDHWDMHVLANTSYVPAGPLFDIKSPGGQLNQLHLPHCEVGVYAAEKLLVAHLCRNNKEFLKPKRVTHSHATLGITGLSRYGVVRLKKFYNQRIQGQVLLFLEPDITDTQQRLWIFLLPRSVPFTQVEKHNKEYKYIRTSSNCILRPKGKYSVTSGLKQGFNVQPKKYILAIDYSPDQHATFEMFLSRGVRELRMRIQEKIKQKLLTCWSRRVILKTQSADNVPQLTKQLSEQQWLTTLCSILDDLSERDKKKLKGLMRNTQGRPCIPRSAVEGLEEGVDLADLMVNTWGMRDSIKAAREFMEKLPRNDDKVTFMLRPFLDQLG